MIQRVQTIYLLLASLLSGILPFFLNLWYQIKNNTPVFSIDLLSENTIFQKLVPLCFFSSSLISFITLFLFKSRSLQVVLGRFNLLINLFLIGLLFFLLLTLSGEALVSEKGIGIFIPIVVILLIIFANKAIIRDENLVKSVDRLR